MKWMGIIGKAGWKKKDERSVRVIRMGIHLKKRERKRKNKQMDRISRRREMKMKS
jgi:hypothetical protein